MKHLSLLREFHLPRMLDLINECNKVLPLYHRNFSRNVMEVNLEEMREITEHIIKIFLEGEEDESST